MNEVVQLGYAGFGVKDLAQWERFSSEVLGLEISEHTADGAILLRMDDRHFRFIVTPNGADDLNLLGWEVRDSEALRSVAQRLTRAGIEVHQATPQEAAKRKVVELIALRDPSGIATEISYGALTVMEKVHLTRALSGFVTGPDLGFGHITMGVDNFDASLHFYRDLLGLRETCWARPPAEPNSSIGSMAVTEARNLVFLRCNRRHHSVGFWEGHGGQRIQHVMLQLNSLDDVGSTYDLCHDLKTPISLSLGRHTSCHMVSFYVTTPSGFDVEWGWGAPGVDDETWQVELLQTGSVWGHRKPAA